MKIPRMTVRHLMLAVVVFAAGWWAIETASRRESYRLKAIYHARRVEQLRSFQDGWVEAINRAGRLLKTDRGPRDAEEVERLNHWVKNLLERSSCTEVDYEVVGHVDSSDPSGWDKDFQMVMDFSRRNISHLVPLLAYHESLLQKYEHAENRPWQKVPSDPPMPSTPDYR